MYIWDGDIWKRAHCWLLILATPGAEATLRTMQYGDTLSQADYDRLEPGSKDDIARWMAEGSVHKVPAPKAGKKE